MFPSLVKGDALKMRCNMLRGFKSRHQYFRKESLVHSFLFSVFARVVKGLPLGGNDFGRAGSNPATRNSLSFVCG